MAFTIDGNQAGKINTFDTQIGKGSTPIEQDASNGGGSAVAFDLKHGAGHIGKMLLQGQMGAEGSSVSSFSA